MVEADGIGEHAADHDERSHCEQRPVDRPVFYEAQGQLHGRQRGFEQLRANLRSHAAQGCADEIEYTFGDSVSLSLDVSCQRRLGLFRGAIDIVMRADGQSERIQMLAQRVVFDDRGISGLA